MVGEADAADEPSGPPTTADFVIRHWRSRALAARAHFLRLCRPDGGNHFEGRPWAEEGSWYTSLHDLIDSPPPPPSPRPSWGRSPATPGGGGGAGEILISNRLVKRAAYAYLQPAPSVVESDRCRSLRRAVAILTCGLAVEPLVTCIDFIRRVFRRRHRRLF